ncbi:ankyrin repeat-containing protein [Salix suchowensis]|nr:ankyrin repeat-containing protein [Salix suchowensis]
MQKPYRAAMRGDWKNIIHHYEDRPMDLSFPVTLSEDTALHIAVYSKQAEPLQSLLGIVEEYMTNFMPDMDSPAPENESPSTEQMKFLMSKNKFGNTALHEATICGNYEAVRLLVNQCADLLKEKNNYGETPLFTAAAFGEADIVVFLLMSEPEQRVNAKYNLLEIHRKRKDGLSILNAAILGQHFETSLLLLQLDGSLHDLKDEDGRTALQYLANMPSAFKNVGGVLFFYMIIDLGFWPARLERFWNQKIKHVFALRLAKLLIEKDDQSWKSVSKTEAGSQVKQGHQKKGKEEEQGMGGGGNKKGENELSYSGQPSEIPSKSKELEVVQHPTAQPSAMSSSLTSNEQISLFLATGNGIEEIVRGIIKQYPHAIKKLDVTNSSLTREERIPLFLATRNGIEEIVWEIIDQYPHAIEKLNDEGQSILDVAVMHRQKKIFSLVKQQKVPLARLHRVIDNMGNTLLHHVADMEHYRGGNKPGPALKLQEELQWFERVRDVIPFHYATLPNGTGKTAGDLFKESHEKQLENARTWIKETTQSCSTVSALVATVVFAAAYTVPGGSDDSGKPNFIDSPYFLVFTVSDVLSLASSLTSLVVFLSLLTSPFELQDFRVSLPRKLLVGFTFLFFAVITTMLSFGATILILIQSEKKLTTLLLSIAAFLPVLVFAIMQFRLYVSFMGSTYNIRKITGKALPSFLFPCLPRGKKLHRA